jgi:serine protease Do
MNGGKDDEHAMKKFLPKASFGAVALILGLALAPTDGALAQRSSTPESFADLAEQLTPAVVNISTTQKLPERNAQRPEMPQLPPGSPFEEYFREFFDRQGPQNRSPRRVSSLGSGFVIDAQKGYVVTNNHVIADADEIKVILADNTVLEAKIIGRDDKMDLAVLQVPTDSGKLKAVKFGSSDQMRVGDWVLAIGNPFGLGGTVTAGIISARERNINAGPYDEFLQTDASINRGNSGGPMFNTKGEVIGINTAIYSPSGGSVGIGFAIPSTSAEPVISQLIEFGRTKRGWMGVRIQGISDDVAKSLGLKDEKGALIASVTKDGPADKAGIQAGDVITEFNGVTINEVRDLTKTVAATRIGSTAPVKFIRRGEVKSARITVGELEEAERTGLLESDERSAAPEETMDSLGLALAALTPQLRREYGIPDSVQGVAIIDVARGTAAQANGIEPGDVIVEVNQQRVASAKDIADKVEEMKKAGRESLLLLVARKAEQRVYVLPISE